MANRQDRRRQLKAAEQHYRHIMRTARTALDEGREKDAELAFKEALAAAPGEAEPHHMLALMAYRTGRFEDAGNHIVEAALRAEDDIAVNADCGAIMNVLGRPAEAEAACRHVIDLDSDHVEAYNNLSVALSMQGKLEEALEVCETAISRRPDFADALINKANLLVKMHDHVAAIETFSEAIRIAPENPMARVNLGTALRMVGELDAAEEQCRIGIQLRTDYPEAYASLGNVLAAKGDFEGAMENYRSALRFRPGFGAAQLSLAAAQFKAGQLEVARASYMEIIDMHPAAAPAQTGLGIVHLAAGRLGDATTAFREAVTLDPGQGEAWMNLASALGADMPEEDIAQMSDLVLDTRLDEEQRISLRFALGDVSDRRGEFDAAFVHYQAGNDARKAALANLGKVFDPDALMERAETLCRTFDREFMAGAASDPNSSTLPVFVVGMPRSGTTLVEQILATHPDVHGAGEVASLANAVPGFPDGAGALQSDELSAVAERVLNSLAAHAGGAGRVVDKTPFQFEYLGLVAKLLPGARIIHCRRDPLDTGLSCYFQNFTADYPWSADLNHIGLYTGAYERVMAHWRETLDQPVMEVDYERLVAAPEEESRRMFDYVDLPWDDACLRFFDADRPVLTASNWQVRRPVYTHAVGRARSYDKYLEPLRANLAL